MTDQTTPTTMSTLVDHVAVTDTVVARLAQCPQIQFHHGDGATSGIPRYIADEIGQAVLALVPDEPADITPEQAVLLDAVRDVALSNDAMAGEYAGKQLVRLAAAAFGYPLPEPVQREGGVVGFLYGRPIVTNPLAPVGTASVADAVLRARATGGIVERPVLVGGRDQGPEVLVPTESWPFKPGVVVRDEDGAEAEWLDAAPEETVVIADDGVEWTRRTTAWFRNGGGGWMTSLDLAARGPLTVVSVPAQEADRG